MTDELEEVFGEDFAQGMKERVAERREERNRVTEEQMREICSLAINDGKFDPNEGDPTFSYTTDNGITHQVLLMQVPDPENSEVWEHLSEPWDGAARLPLDYLGEWYWSTFPDKKDVADLSQGDWVVVVGAIDKNEGDDGQVYKSIYPVRGIVHLSEAKNYAQEALEQEGFTSDEEEEETEDEFAFDDSDDEEEESEAEASAEEAEEVVEESQELVGETEEAAEEATEEETGGGLDFSGGGSSDETSSGLGSMLGEEEEEEDEEDEEPSVPYEDIAEVVEKLAEKQDDDEEPQVFEIEENSPHHKRLTKVVCDRLEIEDEEAAAEVVIDVIRGNRSEEEEEEEEEDDDIDTIF